jgi:hypothetical protein
MAFKLSTLAIYVALALSLLASVVQTTTNNASTWIDYPELASFALDCNFGKLTLTYENVLVSARTLSFNATFLTLDVNGTIESNSSFVLKDSERANAAALFDQGNTSEVLVYLRSNDYAALLLGGYCSGINAPYIKYGNGSIQSYLGQPGIAASAQAIEVVQDTTSPFVSKFEVVRWLVLSDANV